MERHIRKLTVIAALALAAPAAPALADAASVAYFTRETAAAVPVLLSGEERAWYAAFFAAVDARAWDRVETLLAERPEGPLHGHARARYYLAPESPPIDLARLTQWLERHAELPQAEAIARVAAARGGVDLPALPAAQSLRPQAGLTRRNRPRSVDDGTMPAEVAKAIGERITADDPDGARLLLDGVDAGLSAEARAEYRQRIAWSYYIENRDAEALAQAQTVAAGRGPWVAEGAWVAGLAAWRLGDCREAAIGFAQANRAADPELAAAANYWLARSFIRCRQPGQASAALRQAARFDETLYGMLALEQLGAPLPATHLRPDLTAADWQRLERRQTARTAVMLAELGRRGEASEALRHQARIGPATEFLALARLARALGLPEAQRFMAYNAPTGARPDPAARWPITGRQPQGGWRVDPALAFAHALQESSFREEVVSPANAIGLMQVRPIAAREHADEIGLDARTLDLKDPAVNLALGQEALRALAASPNTRGALPKVIAAYNAGMTPVARWNSEIRDSGDALLYMESIPYWETRAYANIVLRNYWMYLRQAGAPAASRTDLAQNRWPAFPRER
ncbi:transglycosylase SLT domain-containing protein [Qipengyuania sediminis]|uniref:transglycosylase SLT domain-containing protein n=1 Tax=Qipengyuania sediminis TaxID=1532023 RepID=UPI001F0FD9DF|nr:transglycosylase SLT domain-containing protein [Qipengyuania sediminis]